MSVNNDVWQTIDSKERGQTIFFLILINGLLAMSELAVVSSRKSRLEHLANHGGPGARAALRLIDNPSRFLSTVQIGITLVGIIAGAFSGATLGQRLGAWLNTLTGIDMGTNVELLAGFVLDHLGPNAQGRCKLHTWKRTLRSR